MIVWKTYQEGFFTFLRLTTINNSLDEMEEHFASSLLLLLAIYHLSSLICSTFLYLASLRITLYSSTFFIPSTSSFQPRKFNPVSHFSSSFFNFRPNVANKSESEWIKTRKVLHLFRLKIQQFPTPNYDIQAEEVLKWLQDDDLLIPIHHW